MNEIDDLDEDLPVVSHREVFCELRLNTTCLADKTDELFFMDAALFRLVGKATHSIANQTDTSKDEAEHTLRTIIDVLREKFLRVGNLSELEIDALSTIVQQVVPEIEIPRVPTAGYLFTALNPKLSPSIDDSMERYDQAASAALRVMTRCKIFEMGYATLQQIAKKIAENGDTLSLEARTIRSVKQFEERLRDLVLNIVIFTMDSGSRHSLLLDRHGEHFDERQELLACRDSADFEDDNEVLVDLFIKEYVDQRTKMSSNNS